MILGLVLSMMIWMITVQFWIDGFAGGVSMVVVAILGVFVGSYPYQLK